MFGEEKIFFEEKILLDKKRRIIIPSVTKVVKEEPIGFIYDKQQNCLLLYNHFEYEAILKKALQTLERMKKSKKYDPKFLRALERNFFSKSCFPEEFTTNALQLLLPKKAVEILEFQTSVYAVGVDMHLALFKDEKTYKNTATKI